MRQATLSIIIVLFAAGCASIATPKSVDQQIAYAYSTLAGVRDTAAGLLERDRITVQQAAEVQVKADEARRLLDTAKDLVRNNQGADGYDTLMLAQRIIFELESYLKEK